MLKPYESYKKTDIKWLDEVPEHWDWWFLSQVSSEQLIKNHENVEKNVLSLSYGNIIRKKNIDFGLVPKEYNNYQIVENGNIILRLTDLQNDKKSLRTGLVKERGIITSAYTCLKPICNPHFLQLLLHAFDIQKVFYGIGGGVRQSIGFSDIRNMRLPIPPRKEQDQIVRYLDWQITKINKLVSAKKRQIELLKEQKQAVINKAVTKGIDDTVQMKDSGVEWLGKVPVHWEVNRLKNGCLMISRGVTPQYTEDDKTAMVVNQATFSKGYWDISKVRYTITSPLETRGLLKDGDVLLASTGGGVLGKVFHYSENGTFIADSHVTIIRCNNKLYSKYVYYNFSTKYDLINALLAQGSTNQTELQRDWLVAFHFPFPPLEEQQAIVDYITNITEKIDTIIKETEQEIELLSEYKQSLISSVVTGKVDVRNVVVPDFEIVEEVTANKANNTKERERI